ncbi:VP3 [Chicken proventriculitis-associated circular virus 30]|nr:VP3 [Chicken proventriculitis-associated circular virus 30]
MDKYDHTGFTTDEESQTLGSEDTTTQEHDSEYLDTDEYDSDDFWGSDEGASPGGGTAPEADQLEAPSQELVPDLPPVPYHQGGSATEFNQEIWRGTQVDRHFRGGTFGRDTTPARFPGTKHNVCLKSTYRFGLPRGKFQSPPRQAWKLPSNQGHQEEPGVRDQEGQVPDTRGHRLSSNHGQKRISVPADHRGADERKDPRRDFQGLPPRVLFKEKGDRRVSPYLPAGPRRITKTQAKSRKLTRSKLPSTATITQLVETELSNAGHSQENSQDEAPVPMRTSGNGEKSPPKPTAG